MARYMWEALEDRDDVEVWSTGPFFNNWIPWNNGIYLDQKYVKNQVSHYHQHLQLFQQSLSLARAPDNIDLWIRYRCWMVC